MFDPNNTEVKGYFCKDCKEKLVSLYEQKYGNVTCEEIQEELGNCAYCGTPSNTFSLKMPRPDNQISFIVNSQLINKKLLESLNFSDCKGCHFFSNDHCEKYSKKVYRNEYLDFEMFNFEGDSRFIRDCAEFTPRM